MERSTLHVRAPAISRELLLVSALFLAIVGSLFAVTWVGVYALSAVRGYVAGEALYSKGQKDAVYHLVRYALTRDEEEYRRYQAAIAVPRADGRARSELARGDGSLARAQRFLVEGRNHPDDVESMTALFDQAGWLTEMERATDIWAAADSELEHLERAARSLHTEITGEAPDPMRIERLLAEVDGANARLTGLEDSFSSTLGAGARRVHSIVLGTAVAASLALIFIGIFSIARRLRRIGQSDELFRAMIESAQDSIAIIRPDGRLVYNSPAIQPMLGYRPDALLGRDAFELIHPDDQADVRAALAQVVAAPGSKQSAEYRFRHANGTWRLMASIGGSLTHGAEVWAIVVNSRDITDRKLLEEQLLHGQRMESVGRLAGGIAHDFNNLITIILGSAGAVRDGVPADSSASEEIDEIVHAAERAAGLSRQLLAFARRQLIEPRVFDLDATIRDTESMLRRLIGADIVLEIRPCTQPIYVRADPGQIEQVLVNLVVNARDAMPEGGTVTISTARVNVDAEEARTLTDAVTGPFVRLDVSDTGGAIREEILRHLFEPFFTTKDWGKGTGLGLAICYGIVKQNGGHISVESAPGRGTRFRIHLPYCDEGSDSDAHDAEWDEEIHGGETVLLVEDEPGVRRIASQALRDRGYLVLEAIDGEDALRVAREADVPIDLLVTDVEMPRLGGRQLASRLEAGGQRLPVLYISGYTSDASFEREVRSAGLPFLQKPFTAASLARRVRQVLDGQKSELPAS